MKKVMQNNVNALILAGGRSSRMQFQDKGLMRLNNKPMVAQIVQRLKPQVKEILISANNNLDVYQEYSECVLEDEFDDFRGPIAGICEGLKTTSTDFLLVVPCDGPRLPMDLARRMLASCLKEGSLLATVHDGQFKQPTYSLIHKSLLANAKDFLIRGERKLGQWLKENHSTLVDYSDQPEAFVNINSVEQLQELETRSLQQG